MVDPLSGKGTDVGMWTSQVGFNSLHPKRQVLTPFLECLIFFCVHLCCAFLISWQQVANPPSGAKWGNYNSTFIVKVGVQVAVTTVLWLLPKHLPYVSVINSLWDGLSWNKIPSRLIVQYLFSSSLCGRGLAALNLIRLLQTAPNPLHCFCFLSSLRCSYYLG